MALCLHQLGSLLCTLASAARYKVVKQLGDGTYGSVWKAINRQTNEVVSCPKDILGPYLCYRSHFLLQRHPL